MRQVSRRPSAVLMLTTENGRGRWHYERITKPEREDRSWACVPLTDAVQAVEELRAAAGLMLGSEDRENIAVGAATSRVMGKWFVSAADIRAAIRRLGPTATRDEGLVKLAAERFCDILEAREKAG